MAEWCSGSLLAHNPEVNGSKPCSTNLWSRRTWWSITAIKAWRSWHSITSIKSRHSISSIHAWHTYITWFTFNSLHLTHKCYVFIKHLKLILYLWSRRSWGSFSSVDAWKAHFTRLPNRTLAQTLQFIAHNGTTISTCIPGGPGRPIDPLTPISPLGPIGPGRPYNNNKYY